MKKCLLVFLLVSISLQAAYAKKKITPDSVLKIMDRVASWQLREWQEHGRKHPKWHGGTLPPGIMVDKRGEPIYGTGAPEAGQEVPEQDASGS